MPFSRCLFDNLQSTRISTSDLHHRIVDLWKKIYRIRAYDFGEQFLQSVSYATTTLDNRVHVAEVRDLLSMHAPMFGVRACLNFFGQGSTFVCLFQVCYLIYICLFSDRFGILPITQFSHRICLFPTNHSYSCLSLLHWVPANTILKKS